MAELTSRSRVSPGFAIETSCFSDHTGIYLNDQLTGGVPMKITRFILAALSAAILTAESPVHVTKVLSPDKALRFEVTIPASVDAVWDAFATSRGLSTWLTPEAVVDLRPGGEWTAHYPGGKTGGGTMLSFNTQREIVISAMAPEAFPTVRAERTIALFQFEAAANGSTRV